MSGELWFIALYYGRETYVHAYLQFYDFMKSSSSIPFFWIWETCLTYSEVLANGWNKHSCMKVFSTFEAELEMTFIHQTGQKVAQNLKIL